MIRLYSFLNRHRILTAGLVAAVVGLGTWAAFELRKEGFPNVSTNRLLVRVPCPSYIKAGNVERDIVAPLEKRLGPVSGITEIRSLSCPGDAYVEVLVDDNVDEGEFQRIFAQVKAAVRKPDDEFADPPSVRRLTSSDLPVLELGLSGSSGDLQRVIGRLRPRLARTRGVREVLVLGPAARSVGPTRIPVPGSARPLVRNAGRPGAAIFITKDRDADILETVDALRTVAAEIQLPDDVEMTVMRDASRLTRDRLKLVGRNALVGFLLVLVLLFAVYDPRTAFWTAMGIPFALLCVLLVLLAAGESLNALTLAGCIIVLGMLVDDAIVVADSVARSRASGLPPAEAAAAGVRAVWRPVLGATLTTIIAFLPLLSMRGLPGKFIWVVPLVVVLGLGFSLGECFLLLPAHISGGRGRRSPAGALMAWLERGYRRILEGVLRFRYLLIPGFAAALVLAGLLAAKKLRWDPFPQDAAESFTVRLQMPETADTARTAAVLAQIEGLVLDLPAGELAALSTRIGTDSTWPASSHGGATHRGVAFVYLTPLAERNRTAEQIIAALRARFEAAAREAGATTRAALVRYGPPLGRPFEIRVSSPRDDLRESTAEGVHEFVSGLDGVRDLEMRRARSGYSIRRSGAMRTTEISGSLDKRRLSPENLMNAVRAKFDCEATPAITFAGQPVENTRVFGRLHLAAILALFGIYLLMTVTFASAFKPLVVMASLPFGALGIVVCLLVHGQPFSAFAGTALIGLFGVVVNDSIIMVHRMGAGGQGHDSGRSELAVAAASRLRPVLITTATTVLGVLPAAYSLGGYDPFVSPMCLSLAWGLAFGTLVTLLLVPALYAVGQDLRRLLRGRQADDHPRPLS